MGRRRGSPSLSARRSTSTGPRASPRTWLRSGLLARCASGSSSPTGTASLTRARWSSTGRSWRRQSTRR
eukprot:9650045-Lingulodinium_polyedra.AAC.1